MRALPLLILSLLALRAVTAPLGGRRALRAAAAPAPSVLDRPSGGGDGCQAAALLLPDAGPAITAAAAELLATCAGSNDQGTCDQAATNATYLVSAAVAITLTLTAAEEGVVDASCAGETEYAATGLLESFKAGVQEGCLNPAAADGAASAMAQVLGSYAPKLPAVLPGQYDLRQEQALNQAALDLGVAMSSDVGKALAWAVTQCSGGGAGGPSPAPGGGASPSPSPQLPSPSPQLPNPSPSPQLPNPSPTPVPSSPGSGGDLGDYGAAVLPNLEAARHDAFMQILG